MFTHMLVYKYSKTNIFCNYYILVAIEMQKPVNLLLIAYALAFILCSNYVCGCIETEKQVLLLFNSSRLIDNHNRLNLWTGDDCCSWLGIKCNNHGHVTELDLEYSTLTGLIPSNIGNLTFLTYLDFMGNYIQGLIPDTIGGLTSLSILNLVDNNLNGSLPESLCHLSKLECLNVNSNQLSGSVPKCIGGLSNLNELDLSSNSWEGLISEQHFINLTSLTSLSISSKSNLVFTVDSEWISPFQLEQLYLDSVNVGPDFPSWLPTQRNLKTIMMLNTSISDSIPDYWFVTLLSGADTVELSNNDINLPRPSLIPATKKLTRLALSNNHLSSDFPAYIRNFTSLSVLLLFNTNISSQLPRCLRNLKALYLSFLVLRDNNFYGTIPKQFCNYSSLQVLNLAGNHITGNLPPCLNNLTAMTTSEMVEDYLFLDMSESLIDNAKGYELEYTLTNIFLFSIDLSNNNISVEIPEELMDLRNLLNLNLAGNNLAGRIPDRIGQMEQLEYLDLSRNKLHGPIPQTVSELEFLIHLNLSFNDLSGRIPTGNPLQVLENLSSIYVGNNQLCGRPTLKLCAGDPEPHEGPDNKKTGSDYDSDSGNECVWIYAGIGPGLLVGFLGFCASMHFIKEVFLLPFCRRSRNHITGNLPSIFNNLTAMTTNEIGYNSRHWHYGERLIDNAKVYELEYTSILGYFFSIDLSNNNISGEIPEELMDLRNLLSLNLAGLGCISCNKPKTCYAKTDLEVNSIFHMLVYKYSKTRILFILVAKEMQKHINLLLLALAYVLSSNFVWGYIESEKQVLLHFNESRGIDPYIGPLTFWVEDDCCSWWGIQCNDDGHVIVLDLGGLSFTGLIPEDIGSLTFLTSLRLNQNHFQGPIPSSIQNLTSLLTLDLWLNNLNGSLPESLCHLSKLESLDVSYNKLSGSIPKCIGGLSNLYELDLYSNSWEGSISEEHFVNLTGLTSLSISSDSTLVFNVDSEWIPPFQLTDLYLESVNVGPNFPSWLLTQRDIYSIWMPNTSLPDTIPADWFVSLLSHARDVDLSNNNINLPRPLFIPAPNNMTTLALSNNHLSSDFPAYICNFTFMNTLDLSNTNISGELPRCLGNLTLLGLLNVMNNNLSGDIPDFFGSVELGGLHYLNLHNNKFQGKLPLSMQKLSILRVFDAGKNNLRDILPSWTGEQLPHLKILVLRANHFYGSIPKQFCNYSSIQVFNLAGNNITGKLPPCFNNLTAMTTSKVGDDPTLLQSGELVIENAKGSELEYKSTLDFLFSIDLSNNNISGEIPEEFMDLRNLINLNLAGNNLSGRIPDRIGKMEQLEYLDLSKNKLSGPIPRSVSELKFLSHLNLSFNDLSGRIPTGTQLQVLDNPSSIYAGNNQICGQPTLNPCAGDPKPHDQGHDYKKAGPDSDSNSNDEHVWIYAGIGPGLLVGFLGFCASLHFIKSWRYSYFHFVEEVFDKIALLIALSWKKFFN
ncbi:uncharacterized protein LOC141717011 [Apium graveolens]|uniref:uncharacterized protein LOC141717011 n=1 Tax=Apium graveolens TaxID=4045 RepID=UPI003D790DCB